MYIALCMQPSNGEGALIQNSWLHSDLQVRDLHTRMMWWADINLYNGLHILDPTIENNVQIQLRPKKKKNTKHIIFCATNKVQLIFFLLLWLFPSSGFQLLSLFRKFDPTKVTNKTKRILNSPARLPLSLSYHCSIISGNQVVVELVTCNISSRKK
jgi:hypothetical protein